MTTNQPTDTNTGLYEVREQLPNSKPEDRGILISVHKTFAEAFAVAEPLYRNWRNVFISLPSER